MTARAPLAAALVLAVALPPLAAEPARALTAEEAAARADSVAQELGRRIEVLAEELERLRLGPAAAPPAAGAHGLAPGAARVYGADPGVSIGGYGELLYERFPAERDDGTAAGEGDVLDFLRAVLYVGTKFTDRWIFNSEIEVEHAATGQAGSVALEFAYVEYLWREAAALRAGLLLVPVGLTNEIHEPIAFLGARRPAVESAIIPTTWRENGAGLYGRAGPLDYRSVVVNGLDARGFGAAGLRGGRQKGSQARADDLAWVGRLDWRAGHGLTVGGSVYAGRSGQGIAAAGGERLDVSTTIAEGHLTWRSGGIEARALAARAGVGDAGALNAAPERTGSGAVGEVLAGGYVEVGYDLFSVWPRGEAALLPYVRFEHLDPQAEMPAGFAADPARRVTIWTVGAALRPIPALVLKADYQEIENDAGTALDQINVALGYVF